MVVEKDLTGEVKDVYLLKNEKLLIKYYLEKVRNPYAKNRV